MVVFDRIAPLGNAGLLETTNTVNHGLLDIARQRRRDAVGIDRSRIEPLRLKEDLVAVAVGETANLVLDRRAIARAAATRIAPNRAASDSAAAAMMSWVFGRRVGRSHRRAAADDTAAAVAHRPVTAFRRLNRERRPVDGAAIESRRRAGLEPGAGQGELAQLRGEAGRCRRTASAAGPDLVATKQARAEKGTAR